MDVLGQSVTDPFALGLEGAEHAVPDDEDAAVVTVEVLALAAVVDPMMRRRVEHELEPTRQLVDRLGMDPVLVDEVEPARHRDDPRANPDEGERREEHDRRNRQQRLTQRGRQVVVLAGVMIDVRRP
ncbi:MAG: hypothetical protein R2689_07535 [Microthrixaceae bacterium]